uniref:FCH and double SH3 domains 2 n=1 Tax=Pavo cristatus TaxID=9049 RepID=A0A8C9F6X3_PAVCR
MAFSRTELETCQAVQNTFQFLLETSSRVVRDYNLQQFLQEHPVFHKPQPFQFQPSDSDTSRQLESETGTTEEHSLNKEARKWATRVAREHKNIIHSQRINADTEKEEGEEFEDSMDVFDDSSSSPSGTLRNYPLTCKVVYSYKASQPDELTIEEHEVLEVIEDGDMEDWVKARNKAGQVGYVPEKYLQFPTSSSLLSMLQSLAALDSRSHTSNNSTEADLVSGSLNGDSSVCFVKALYDYEGQTDDELSFPEGAIIRILNKENQDDDGFWEGEFNGRVGVFPSVLVEELTASENGEAQWIGDIQVREDGRCLLGLFPVGNPTSAHQPFSLLDEHWPSGSSSLAVHVLHVRKMGCRNQPMREILQDWKDLLFLQQMKSNQLKKDKQRVLTF